MDKKETKEAIIERLAKRGLTAREISEKTGINPTTVYWYMNYRGKKKEQTGRNADRHLCKTCKYRSKYTGCDYYLVTDRERGCLPEECTEYARGNRLHNG